jgi:Tol biopolymer transport system component
MKKLSSLLVIITAAALVLTPADLAAQRSQSADVLLGAALHQEEVEGDYEAAIKTYKKLLAEFPDNRPLAAQAQFRIGMCYEKLGRKEAQKAYQAVIQNYGEQKEVVAKAQERLSKLKLPGIKPEEPEGIRIKQIWKKPYLDYLGTVSYDGRFLSYVDWGEGDVAIHNLISGENRLLTHEATLNEPQHIALSPAISKNGKQVAYSWWNGNHTSDLRLLDVENPSPRILYRHEGEEVYPVTWLSDKELIVTRFNYETKIGQTCSFSILDGTIHELKTSDWKNSPQLSCSPDEKYIAYDFANENNSGNFDINILAVDGGREISLVKHPANDRVLGWVPGRKEFLFISDRSGTWDLWAIPVDDGKPSGAAKRIYTDIGEVSPVGFTQNGDCFFGFTRRNFNAYIAPFNAETGELKDKSGKSLLGSNFGVKWSPDGQYLAYIKEDNKADNPWQLTIQDLKTGEERKLADDMRLAMSPCWSPDGNSILVTGISRSEFHTKGRTAGIYRVDVKTGQTTEILNLSEYKNKINPPGDDAFPLSDIQWSLDGKSIFFMFFTDRLVKRDLESGEDKILYKHPHFDRGVLKRSPDGKSLLFAVRSPEEKKSHLYTMPVEGGKEKELCTSLEASGFEAAIWSPDGKYIYFTESDRWDETSLWRIPAEGGIPQKVWHSKNSAYISSIRPDGQQIALAVQERTTEIRVIENLVQELEKIYDKSK